jgi:sirohydrochlorin cobaltochelatase
MERRAILLVGHGSHINANSSAPVHQHAETLRQRGDFEVRTAFWKEEPSLARALDGVDATDVTVVPVFISTGYFTEQVIPREMRITSRLSQIDGKVVRYTLPVGSHPALAQVVIQRATEAGAMRQDALAVLGHGTPRNPNSAANIYRQAEHVRAAGLFDEVVTVFMDQEPAMDRVFALATAERVVMVPLFIADGWHVDETIPAALSLDGAEARQGGRRLRYAAAVGTHPSVADVIGELVAEAATW